MGCNLSILFLSNEWGYFQLAEEEKGDEMITAQKNAFWRN